MLNLIIAELAKLPVLPFEDILNEPFAPIGDDLRIEVSKLGDVFVIENQALIRRIARFDLSNDDSIRSLQKLIKGWGVEAALIAAGVNDGDSVRIGDFEFTYQGET